MKKITALSALALLLIGCDAGNAPAPMSDSDVKSAIDKMSPEQRIKFIEGSPASAEEKKRQIDEIKKQNGLK